MMYRVALFTLVASWSLWFGGVATSLAQQPAANEADSNEGNESDFKIPPEEQPFWDSAKVFLDAYANRDSKAIGELFTEDAEIYDEFGELTFGRDAIISLYQDVFDNDKQASIEEIRIDRVRHITDNVAMEEGTIVESDADEGGKYQARYIALHTKGDDGTWRINTLKDRPRELMGRREQLEQLSWLTGEWVNQDSASVVHTECDWSEDGNYLLRRFTVQTYNGREMNGVQRIGWDALRKKLHSWTFDSEGGFFNGLWTKQDNEWIVTVSGTTADGKVVTGTAVYTVVDPEMVRWQYRSLIIDNEVQNDSKVITMVRPPPEPETTSK